MTHLPGTYLPIPLVWGRAKRRILLFSVPQPPSQYLSNEINEVFPIPTAEEKYQSKRGRVRAVVRTQAPLSPANKTCALRIPKHTQMWMQTHKHRICGNVYGRSQNQVVLSSRAGRITLLLCMYLISMPLLCTHIGHKNMSCKNLTPRTRGGETVIPYVEALTSPWPYLW